MLPQLVSVYYLQPILPPDANQLVPQQVLTPFVVVHSYVEELTAFTLGADQVVAFWDSCFAGQKWFLTKPGSTEHRTIWDESRGGTAKED